MFGNNKSNEDSKKSPVSTQSGSINTLVKGTQMEGNLTCNQDLRIDGTATGTIVCKAKLIIGPSGTVEGEIQCQNAVIEGLFKGKIAVTEILHVRETAEVNGEITTGKLIVQSGAKFNVACKMQPPHAAEKKPTTNQ
jgi:cytoskeletal protein CcmA (bactofilin family)